MSFSNKKERIRRHAHKTATAIGNHIKSLNEQCVEIEQAGERG